MTGAEHEEEFNRLYPALDKVFEKAGHQPEASTEQLHQSDFLRYWINMAEATTDPTLKRVGLRNQEALDRLERKLLDGEATPIDARNWYLRLGAHNSLAGAEDHLVMAARVASEVGPEAPFASSTKLTAACMLYEASIVSIAGRLPPR